MCHGASCWSEFESPRRFFIYSTQLTYMSRPMLRLLRPSSSSLVLPVRRISGGQKFTMASMATPPNAANGKHTTWEGAGAAEFDLRSG